MLDQLPVRMSRFAWCFLVSVVGALALGMPATAADPPTVPDWSPEARLQACQELESASLNALLDGRLEILRHLCGRGDGPTLENSTDGEGKGVTDPGTASASTANKALGLDVRVNDPDFGLPQTQAETTLAHNPLTGVLCSAYVDQGSGQSSGIGFARSLDGGTTFLDEGALPSLAWVDPSLVWRRADGNFYLAALVVEGPITTGVGIWRSTDDCASFQYVGKATTGGKADKELLGVDNTPSSPYFGRLYLAWTEILGTQVEIRETHSSNGGVSWTPGQAISSPGWPTAAWPAVAPDGTVGIAWVRWTPNLPNGNLDIEVVRSTNGGQSYQAVAQPMTNRISPRDATATQRCFPKGALEGKIRYLPAPQLVIGADGVWHVVYSYDPDGYNTGDVVDVFYRRSTNQGSSWGPEIRLNDDSTLNDQFFPTLSVGQGSRVVATWYDRRDDPSNLAIRIYARYSEDNGLTWQPSQALSEQAFTPRQADDCYHGDYDVQLQVGQDTLVQWTDQRDTVSGAADANVYFRRQDPSKVLQDVGEVGRVTLSSLPTSVSFTQSYTNPVVLVQPASFNDSQVAVVRLTQVTSTGFTAYVDEAPNLDGIHGAETVSYLVLEEGSWELPDGRRLEVGTSVTSATVGVRISNQWKRIPWPEGFDDTQPLVLSQVQTDNDPSFVKTRQRYVSTGFDVALEEEEVSTTSHGQETVGWVALERGNSVWSGCPYVAGTTPNFVTHSWFGVPLPNIGPDPHLIAGLATYDGADAASVRYRNLTPTGWQLKVEEDQTWNSEQTHTTEIVGFLILGNAGVLQASPY